MKTIKVGNKSYKVTRSTAKGKKFMIKTDDKTIHFGAKGYTINPGTKKGDRYCARSSGIKTKDKLSPNNLSRKMWGCKGKKSVKK